MAGERKKTGLKKTKKSTGTGGKSQLLSNGSKRTGKKKTTARGIPEGCEDRKREKRTSYKKTERPTQKNSTSWEPLGKEKARRE